MANNQDETEPIMKTPGIGNAETLFKKLDADEDIDITEISSLCMDCGKNGVTKMMLTRIPFYRDVIISSFNCEHCHSSNTGVDSANKIQDQGIKMKLTVSNARDLNRSLIKSDYATLKVPAIDLEIPPLTQKGLLTTIEGVLERVITNLKADIELKKDAEKELTDKLALFVVKIEDLRALKSGEFDVIVDDPSGDSFIENPDAPKRDPKLAITHYKRDSEQNERLGIYEDADIEEGMIDDNKHIDMTDEVLKFKNNCPNCNAICETNMKLTDIPHFKQVIIMATVCESCGVRSNEVKSGSGIEEKGTRYILKITDPSDLNRDLLKSETGSLEIPEIGFYVNAGTLGGKFTTIEGILKNCHDQLDSINPFASGGDSDTSAANVDMKECLRKLDAVANGQMMNVTFIIDDPSGNSYLQNVYAPEDDPNMKVEVYERSFDDNEILGLNDMRTENYNEDGTDAGVPAEKKD